MRRLGIRPSMQRVRAALAAALAWLSRPVVRRAITAGLTLLALASMLLLLANNWETLRAWQWHVRPLPLVLSFGAYSVALFLAILAWSQIMNALGTPIHWRLHARIYCVSNLARRLPGVLWHVTGRLLLYQECQASSAVVSVASALELVLMGLAALLVGLLTWPGAGRFSVMRGWAGVASALGLAAAHPRVLNGLLQKLGTDASARPPLRFRQVLTWVALYGLVWAVGGTVLYAVVATVYDLPIELMPRVVGAWSLSGIVSVLTAVLPVGLGLRELTLSLMLAQFLPQGVAVVAAIAARLLLTFYELVWAQVARWIWRQRAEVAN